LPFALAAPAAVRGPRLEAFPLQPESARREIAQPSMALPLPAGV